MEGRPPRGQRAHGEGKHRRRGTVEEVSAGGVVVRGADVLLVVPTRRAANGSRVVALPKGHLDGDETEEQAAAREVREEGGVDADLVEPLGEVRYHYRRDGRPISKRVDFFLFEFRAGTPPITTTRSRRPAGCRSEAVTALTYPGEREMVRRRCPNAPRTASLPRVQCPELLLLGLRRPAQARP